MIVHVFNTISEDKILALPSLKAFQLVSAILSFSVSIQCIGT